MNQYQTVCEQLKRAPKTWLITGVAGFIGSNLLETLLKLDQKVVGLDNFATGHQHNLDEVKGCVSEAQWSNFNFIEADIRQFADCQQLVLVWTMFCIKLLWVLYRVQLLTPSPPMKPISVVF